MKKTNEMNTTTKERTPYQWVRESMRKANTKYRNSNREAYNLIQRKYYETHKDDEEYKQKLRTKALAYYYRKKAKKEEECRVVTIIIPSDVCEAEEEVTNCKGV